MQVSQPAASNTPASTPAAAPSGETVEAKAAPPGGMTDIRQLLSEEELAMLLAGGVKSGKV